MFELDFDAACISRGSLLRWNPALRWSSSFGLRLAEFLGGNLPVIPRYGLTRRGHWEYLLAAILGQPIVAVGHHQDLAEGMDVLAEVAQSINRLGPVQWCNLTTMARTNFTTTVQGSTLTCTLYSHGVDLSLPPKVRQVLIHAAWKEANCSGTTIANAPSSSLHSLDQVREPPIGMVDVDSAGGQRLRISMGMTSGAHPAVTPKQTASCWPMIRRLLTEGRDRLSPIVRSSFPERLLLYRKRERRANHGEFT